MCPWWHETGRFLLNFLCNSLKSNYYFQNIYIDFNKFILWVKLSYHIKMFLSPHWVIKVSINQLWRSQNSKEYIKVPKGIFWCDVIKLECLTMCCKNHQFSKAYFSALGEDTRVVFALICFLNCFLSYMNLQNLTGIFL